MSNNTIQIKRRTSAPGNQAGAPASLAVAELAYNEVDGTLYIGTTTAGGSPITAAAVGGSGAFLALTGTQTADGDYTFTSDVDFTGTLNLAGTEVTATAAELNLLDGAAGASVVNDKAVIYSSFGQIFANGFYTAGDRFGVNSDSDLTIRDASNNDVFSVDSDTGLVTTLGGVSTTGSAATISTNGSAAHISTTGSGATISTSGQYATISTSGADGYIYTSGAGAYIVTNGPTAHIATNGQYAHIYTSGTDAYIQTRTTYKLYNGTYTTTLQHAPAANRDIGLPDADGILLLANSSDGKAVNPVGASSFKVNALNIDTLGSSNTVLASTSSTPRYITLPDADGTLVIKDDAAGRVVVPEMGLRFSGYYDSLLSLSSVSGTRQWQMPDADGTVVLNDQAVNFANLTIGDAATPNVASISGGSGAASFALGAFTIGFDGTLNIIGNGTITASPLGELYASTNFNVGNQIWLDTTGSYAINVGNGAFYVGQSGNIYGANLAVVENLSAGNGNFLYDSGANSLGIGALVVSDTISAAMAAFTVSSDGSVNIGSGSITANAELGDIAASGTIQAGSHLIAGSDISAANGNFFYDGAANSFSVSGTFSVASGVFAVDNGGSLNIGSGNIIADAPSGDLSCSGYFSTAGSAGIDGDLTVGGDINVINSGKIYVQSKEVATKEYVDATKQGLDVKDSVRVATTANITLSGLQTIDGVLVASGDRVLVKNQTTASQNGIYVAASGSWARAADADASSEVTAGMYAFVSEGTTQADSGWVLTTNDTITLGTTALAFTQFSGAGQITAGDGLTKSGNTLNVATASASRIVINADSIDLATTGVSAGSYANVTVDAYGRVTAGDNVIDGGTY